mmetsp:Transcript_28286/g.32723  ORF Transcript_28286/g.32723 Transcript_28286/m.32723 type:complete len:206 (+) Transcript_28286:49-666(+)
MSASLVGTSERGATLYTAVTRMSAMVSSAEVGSTTSVPRTIAAVTATGFSAEGNRHSIASQHSPLGSRARGSVTRLSADTTAFQHKPRTLPSEPKIVNCTLSSQHASPRMIQSDSRSKSDCARDPTNDAIVRFVSATAGSNPVDVDCSGASTETSIRPRWGVSGHGGAKAPFTTHCTRDLPLLTTLDAKVEPPLITSRVHSVSRS